MPTEWLWCEPHNPKRAALRRAWETYYLSRGVAVGRAGSLARVKADKGRPLPNPTNTN